MENSVRWGIIGCGDVTEVKSGPAFRKVTHSELVAVMRRNAEKASDYARRHQVPKWYDDAQQLIHDSEVTAIYVATPPSSHEEYAIEALKAGKPVYVEKPIATTLASATRIAEAAEQTGVKLSVAHYRRALPKFQQIRQYLKNDAIGEVRSIRISMVQSPRPEQNETYWRTDPLIGGEGGLFYDLAPHQLDILIWLFGAPEVASGFSSNQLGRYRSKDMVCGSARFPKDILFTGMWCFTAGEHQQEDVCEIIGSKGKLVFPFFANDLTVEIGSKKEKYTIAPPAHIQQPMIEEVVRYFRGEGPNPCSAEEALLSMKLMETFIN
jgi:predicted dehydrogenase